MVSTPNGILYSLLKEGNSITCNNIDEPGGHHTKWNKQALQRQMLYDLHIYGIFKKLNFTETEERWLSETGGRRRKDIE